MYGMGRGGMESGSNSARVAGVFPSCVVCLDRSVLYLPELSFPEGLAIRPLSNSSPCTNEKRRGKREWG